MANKEQTYTIKIDAELQGLQSKVNDARKALDGLIKSGQAPKGLVSSFEKLETLLGRISDKAHQSPLKNTYSGIEKDLSNVVLLFGDLSRNIDGLKNASKDVKIELFPPEEQAKIKAAITGIENYIKSLDKLKKKQAEVEVAQKTSEKAGKAAETAKKNKTEIKRERDKKVTKRDGLAGTLAALGKEPEKNAVQIAKLTAQISSLDLEIKNLNADYNKASAVLTEANKAAKTAKEAYEGLNQELSKSETDELAALSSVAQKAGVSINKIDGEPARDTIKRLGEAIERQLNEQLSEIPENVEQANQGLKNNEETLASMTNEVHRASQAYTEFNEAVVQKQEFENKIKSFLGLAGAAQVLRSSLRDAISTITELDATMTEMAVVTDLKVSDYWDQLPEYTKRANELGLAINDVYKADTLYYQQGLKTSEVVAISTETMKMAKIAGLDTAEATDRMTAALRGFNMELNEASAQKISDVYSQLAAITAADVDEISTAMTKTASIASSAGMEFETTAAFLSQIIETTRESAETAGTAMKTVIARFQELKKAPEDIGEVDGEIVDANAIETALRSVGVALRDSSGQFRELDDVFMELSGKWDSLDKNTQRYIATIAAGSRQQSRFIAMMSDYGRTQELVTAANTSAGASNRQFAKTMESLGSKLEKLKNAWHEFAMGILESDLVKFGVDVLTKFLEIVNKATGAFKGLGGSLVKIMSVLSVFKLGMKIFEKFKKPLMDVFEWAAKMAGLQGYEAGKNFAEQAKAGAEETVKKQETENADEEQVEQEETEEEKKKTVVQKITDAAKEAAGINDINKGRETNKKARENKKEEILAKKRKKRLEDAEKRFEKASKNRENDPDEYVAAWEEILDAQDNLKEAFEYTQEEQQEIIAAGSEGWKQIGDGIQKAGECAIYAGTALSLMGGVLASLGLEEVGDTLATIGSWLTVIGTGVSALGPIITTIVSQLVAGGVAASIAWIWVTVIAVAIAAIVGIIIGIATAINNASPEKKLEKAQKAAENAAKAADRAAESYDNLVKAIDGLDDKYKSLENLIEGTKEWNEAVREINSSVLDLIDEYPELAKFVKNKKGVLTIDVNSAEVQNAIKDAETRKITTKNESIMADLTVAQAENQAKKSDLSKEAQVYLKDPEAEVMGVAAATGAIATGTAIGTGIGAIVGGIATAMSGGWTAFLISEIMKAGAAIGAGVGTLASGFAGNAAKEAAREDTDKKGSEMTDKIAKAIASGEITATDTGISEKLRNMGVEPDEAEELAVRLSQSSEELRKYGESLNAVEAQQQAAYNAIASSAQQLANTMNMSAEQIQQSSVLVDGDVSGKFYEEEEKKLKEQVEKDSDKDIKDLSEDENAKKAIESKYGVGATMNKKGEVFDTTGEKVDELTSDELISIMATQYATKKTATAIEFSDDAISKIGGIIGNNAVNALYMSNEGQSLTQEDLQVLSSAIGGTDEALTEAEKVAKGNEFAKSWTEMTDTEKEKYKDDPAKFSQEIQDAWNALSSDEKTVYGDDIINFVDDLAEGVHYASESFKQAGDAARDFMTADMAKGFKKKLDDVAEMAGGEEAYKKIQDATDILLGAVIDEAGNIARNSMGDVIYKTGDEAGVLTDDQREAIQSRINMTDWTNQEQLLALQIELEQEYGFTEEAAKNYIEVLGDAAFATSALITTVEVFGDFWKATEKINQSMQRLTALQWEYDRALKNGEGNISNLVNEILDEYKTQAIEYENAYNASTEDLAKIYAQGGLNYKIDLRDFVELGDNGINVDETRLQDAINAGKITDDEANEWLEKLNEQYTNSQDQLQGLRDTLDNIEELEQQGEDAYYELRNMVKETILDTLQKQVDIQQETLDATRDANTQIINKLQEQIDDTRQERENEEARQNIADLQSQQAYLSMDTSGANDLSILELNEQIAQAEQDYQDSLIDQAIQELSDANEKAYEQRERQISLAQSQLDIYSRSEEFQRNIDSQLSAMLGASNWEDTELGKALKDKFTVGMSEEERTKWATEVGSSINLAKIWGETNWGTEKQEIINSIGTITAAITGLGDRITGESSGKKVESQVTTLSGQGFDLSAAGVTITSEEDGTTTITGKGKDGAVDESQELMLDRMTQFANNDTGRESEINSLYSSIQSKYTKAEEYGMKDEFSGFSTGENGEVMSQTKFYEAVSAKVAKGEKATVTIHGKETEVTSYTDYLSKVNSKELTGIDNLSPLEAFGGCAVPGEVNWLNDNEWNSDGPSNFDIKVNGTADNKVKITGAKNKATGKRKSRLEWINQVTGGTNIVYLTDTTQSSLDSGTSPDRIGNYSSIWIKKNGEWRRVRQETTGDLGDPYNIRNAALDYIETQKPIYTKKKFKTGGLADFTGPAWLDGTPSKPEYILNAAQTERFFSLVDVLEGFDDKKTSTNNNNDISVDVDINVESIGSDYDVEQLANKIRSMLRDDAMYRNVNNINQVR